MTPDSLQRIPFSQALRDQLDALYKQNGICPDNAFSCSKNCAAIDRAIHLTGGMQCHVGTHYGEEGKLKVLFISLDCGAGGKGYIDDRTRNIEQDLTINPHIRGTIKTIADLYEAECRTRDILKYCCITNSCKCCRHDNTDQLPSKYYECCAFLKEEEIKIIDPDVIYFQGERSFTGLETKTRDLKNIPDDLKHYCFLLTINGKSWPAVKCIHPSARGKHARRKQAFYDSILPRINDHIRQLYTRQ